MIKKLLGDWATVVGEIKLKKILENISNTLVAERKTKTVLPEAGSKLLFQAFRETPYQGTTVVILGQEPYHDGSYNGLAFGNGDRTENKLTGISQSLHNVMQEVEEEYGDFPKSNLYEWAYQGVLLMNTAHSVIKGDAGSHLELWKEFTEEVIGALNKKDDIVWMLWGSKAQKWKSFITNETHEIIEAGHPSPLNRSNPFVGSNVFKDCNKILKKKGYDTIDWK